MKDWLCSACSIYVSINVFDFSCWPGHSFHAFICDQVGSHLHQRCRLPMCPNQAAPLENKCIFKDTLEQGVSRGYQKSSSQTSRLRLFKLGKTRVALELLAHL